jgi:hypothetical protein
VDGVFALNEAGESLEGALVTIYNAKVTSVSNQYGEIAIVDDSGVATQVDNELGFDLGQLCGSCAIFWFSAATLP